MRILDSLLYLVFLVSQARLWLLGLALSWAFADRPFRGFLIVASPIAKRHILTSIHQHGYFALSKLDEELILFVDNEKSRCVFIDSGEASAHLLNTKTWTLGPSTELDNRVRIEDLIKN